MYYENETILVTGTFKPMLLIVGAVVAPFAVLLFPGGLTFIDVIWWVLLLAALGALAGTLVGYFIDSLVDDFRQYRRAAE